MVVTVALAELGFGLTGVAFLVATGRGFASLGLGLPSERRTVLTYAVGSAVALFAFRSVVLGGAAVAGVPLTPPRLVETPVDTRAFALALIPLSLFVVGPCEELLFRGVVQRYLAGAVSTRGAILGAGLLFAVVHAPSYLAFSALGAAVSLFVIFVVGLGFGYVYEHTGSLVVPIVVHGLYNALILASALVLAEFGVVTL